MDKIINRKIIIDSCILIYYHEKTDGGETRKLIEEFKSNNNKILFSAISGFEVLKNRQNGENIKLYEDLLNDLTSIPIDKAVLMNAATLFHLYKKLGKSKEEADPKDKLTGDLIIGGTVLSYQNYLLLTANKKDFPEPYWKIADEILAGKIRTYLLEPDNEIIEKEIPITHLEDSSIGGTIFEPRD